MVSAFRISVVLDIGREVLWKVRATRAYMRFLTSNGAIKRMEKVQGDETGESGSRTLIYVPANVDIPEMMRSLVDDSYMEIRDTQTWDDKSRPFRQHSSIRPVMMGDVVCTTAVLSVEEVQGDAQRCVHTIEGECCVRIPWVGYYAEQAIISNMQSFYETYNAHVRAFVGMVQSEFGDGSAASVPAAVDKLLLLERAS
ncbi:unnamed protein product [Agarophyton chilense]